MPDVLVIALGCIVAWCFLGLIGALLTSISKDQDRCHCDLCNQRNRKPGSIAITAMVGLGLFSLVFGVTALVAGPEPHGFGGF